MSNYEDSFNNDMPLLESERKEKEIQAAVLRFITEIKKQAIYLSSQIQTINQTGEVQVGTTPITVIPEKPERRNARIMNVGQIQCVVYAENKEKGYPLKAGDEFVLYGTNAVEVATVSGISFVAYLDS